MTTLLFVGFAYLLGSLSFAVIVSRVMRLPDPRAYGSGNPGATNVLRTGRKTAAALTLLGDGLKGWAAVWLAQRFAPQFGLDHDVALWCGLAALIGHLFPVFFGFKGGKGVATALGVLLGFNLWLGLACMATWLAMAGLFRISSLAALTAAALAPVYAGTIMGWGKAAWVVLAISILLFYRHTSNIRKLIAGVESRIDNRPSSQREAKNDALRAPPPQPSPASGRGSKREAKND
jgi:glycerol-3-phosphate acyltransferase PlsY